jgi:hypothetical protein
MLTLLLLLLLRCPLLLSLLQGLLCKVGGKPLKSLLVRGYRQLYCGVRDCKAKAGRASNGSQVSIFQGGKQEGLSCFSFTN